MLFGFVLMPFLYIKDSVPEYPYYRDILATFLGASANRSLLNLKTQLPSPREVDFHKKLSMSVSQEDPVHRLVAYFHCSNPGDHYVLGSLLQCYRETYMGRNITGFRYLRQLMLGGKEIFDCKGIGILPKEILKKV
jgi:hypothetical protein